MNLTMSQGFLSLISSLVLALPAAAAPQEVFVMVAGGSPPATKLSLGSSLQTLIGETLEPNSRVHVLDAPSYRTVTTFEVPAGVRRARLHHRSLKPVWRSLARFLKEEGGESTQLNVPLLATKVRELRRTTTPVSIILTGTLLYDDPQQASWRFNPLVPTDDCLDAPHCPFATGPDFPESTRVSWLVPSSDFQIDRQVLECLFHFYRLHFQKKDARLVRITDHAASAFAFEPPQFEGTVEQATEGVAMRNVIFNTRLRVLPPPQADQQTRQMSAELTIATGSPSVTEAKQTNSTQSTEPARKTRPRAQAPPSPPPHSPPATIPPRATTKPTPPRPTLVPIPRKPAPPLPRTKPSTPIAAPAPRRPATPPRPPGRSSIPCQGGRVVFVVDRSKSMIANEDDVSTAWKDLRLKEDLYRNIRTLPFLEFAVVGYRSIKLSDESNRHDPEFNFFKRWFWSPWWMVGSTSIRESACQTINGWPCRGGTPTLEALQQANKLKGITTVVLYSDGPASETDNETVCEYVRSLARRGIVLHTVGVPSTSGSPNGPLDEAARVFLKAVAEAGGGKYFEL